MDENKLKKVLETLLPVVIPYCSVKFAWGVTAMIALVGIAVSCFTGDWSAFSRSGSLIVVCALVLAYFDYTAAAKTCINQAREFFGEQVKKEERAIVKKHVREELNALGVKKSDEDVAYLVERRLSEYWESAPVRFGGMFKRWSLKTEITLAILGTLVWGFGDLIGG